MSPTRRLPRTNDFPSALSSPSPHAQVHTVRAVVFSRPPPPPPQGMTLCLAQGGYLANVDQSALLRGGHRAAPLPVTQPGAVAGDCPAPALGEGQPVCRVWGGGRAQRQGGSPGPRRVPKALQTPLPRTACPQDNYVSCFRELLRASGPATLALPPSHSLSSMGCMGWGGAGRSCLLMQTVSVRSCIKSRSKTRKLPVPGRRKWAERVSKSTMQLCAPHYHHQRPAALQPGCAGGATVTSCSYSVGAQQSVPGLQMGPPPAPPDTIPQREPQCLTCLCTAAPGRAVHTWTAGNFPAVQLRWNHLYSFLVVKVVMFNFLFWFPSHPESKVCMMHSWWIINSLFLLIPTEMKQQPPLHPTCARWHRGSSLCPSSGESCAQCALGPPPGHALLCTTGVRFPGPCQLDSQVLRKTGPGTKLKVRRRAPGWHRR